VTVIKVYTIPEVAKILRISKDTAYTLAYSGQIKTIKVSPKRGLRIPEEALREFLKQDKSEGK